MPEEVIQAALVVGSPAPLTKLMPCCASLYCESPTERPIPAPMPSSHGLSVPLNGVIVKAPLYCMLRFRAYQKLVPALVTPDQYWRRFLKRLPRNMTPSCRLPASWNNGELVMTGSNAGLKP